MQAEEPWFGIVESVLVVKTHEVLAALVGAHSDSLLGELSVLLDVPDLENPVRVNRIDSSTPLVDNHIDNVVVLERWPSSERNRG